MLYAVILKNSGTPLRYKTPSVALYSFTADSLATFAVVSQKRYGASSVVDQSSSLHGNDCSVIFKRTISGKKCTIQLFISVGFDCSPLPARQARKMIDQAGQEDDSLDDETFSFKSLNCKMPTSTTPTSTDDNAKLVNDSVGDVTSGHPPQNDLNSGGISSDSINSPSYMRLSCALSGYHNMSTPRCRSSSSCTLSSRPLYLTERLQTPSPAPVSAANTGKSAAANCAPMTIQEIVESFNRLRLNDNSSALRLLASCQEHSKNRRNSLESAQRDIAAADQRAKVTLTNSTGRLSSRQPEVARSPLVGPVTILSPDEVLRTIIGPEFYKNMAAFERYRLESLCNRLERRLDGRLPSEVRGQTAALVESIKVLLSGKLKPFESQLQSEWAEGGVEMDDQRRAELEKTWKAIATSVEGIDSSLEVGNEFEDGNLTSLADKEMTGNGSVALAATTTDNAQRVDGLYYQQLANQNRNRVEEQCKMAEQDLELVTCEEACDHIRMAVGKAKLLLKKKFKKFEELVGKHLDPVDGEPNVTLDDLEGFWSLVEIELADIESCFEAVRKLKQNNWTAVSEEPPPPQPEPVSANVAKKPTIQKIVSSPKKLWINKRVTEARQRLREAKLMAKQRMMNGQDA
ncbi:guanylate-kinase-associated protein [Trichuris suis]|nr:guanylate-kinase-associated protein [Trichuris suis]